MSRTRRDEARLLSTDEHALVDQTHHPALRGLSDRDLSDLVGRLRERRDRARDVARQQHREFRGKAAPSGTRAATDNSGTREKAALLAAAVQRASKENERRRHASARSDLTRNARRALAMRQAAGDPAEGRPSSQTPGEGMRPIPNEGIAVSGAFDAEGHRPVLERSGMPR
ncbi:MAG: hypothetical protein PGN34_08525 [Methylobacterium frigidaeris]